MTKISYPSLILALLACILPAYAIAQTTSGALEAMKTGHGHARSQPAPLAGSLPPAVQSRLLEDLNARYQPASAERPIKRTPPDYALKMPTSSTSLANAALPNEAKQAAWLTLAAQEMNKRPVHPGGDKSFMATSAFEDMKRNAERQRIK